MEKLALYDDNNNVINEYIERCNKLSIEKGRVGKRWGGTING